MYFPRVSNNIVSSWRPCHIKIPEAMPLGRVCQLHYAAGGSLQYDSCGSIVSLPFAQGPFLQVGQTVAFSISERFGYPEAIDVIPSSKMSQAPTRKVQRSTGRFRNATCAERMEMIRRAEEDLQQLLQDPVDGNEVAKWLHQSVGWLSAPVIYEIHGSKSEAHGDMDAEQMSLQRRLRKLLIWALECLELQDPETYEAIEAVVTHIRALIGDTDWMGDTSTARQWKRLQSLVSLVEPTKAVESEALTSGNGRSTQSSQSTVDAKYCPRENVRRLSTVFCDAICKLQCSECSYILASTWYWKHPKKGSVHVLVPNNGHAQCKLKFGRKIPWNALDGSPTKLDDIYHLDFCHHDRQRSKCLKCGGREICKHQCRRYRCESCKNQPRTFGAAKVQKKSR